MSNQITLKISGNTDELIEFLRLCGKIQNCGFIGTCETFRVTVDGDGSGHLSFAVIEDNKEIPVPNMPIQNIYSNIGE